MAITFWTLSVALRPLCVCNLASRTATDATGTFGTGTDFDTNAVASYYFAVGDVNADGKTDIVTLNEQSDSISILAGNGDGTFQAATTITVGDSVQHRIADINGDQKGDILVTDGNGVSILINGKLSAAGRP